MARVLVIGDTHCPGMKIGYVDFLKRIADRYSINRVIHIGDLVDWASISYHEKSPSLRNASLEYRKALKQVATLARAFPKVDWLIGNHDALTERQAVTAGLPPELLRDPRVTIFATLGLKWSEPDPLRNKNRDIFCLYS